MTASPLPVPEANATDAAASAAVDGIASPEDMAMLGADPAGAARVAALAAVARAVGSPVGAQDIGAAARGLAAALAAFETPATVTTLSSRQPVPRWRRRLLAIAAALVLLGGVGAVTSTVLRQRDPSGSTNFSAAAPTAKSPESVDSAATSPPETQLRAAIANPTADPPLGTLDATAQPVPPDGAVPTVLPGRFSAAVVDGGDLGRQDDPEVLARLVRSTLDGAATVVDAPGTALPSEVNACATADASRAARVVGPLSYRAVTNFQGTPAIILVYARPTAREGRLLLVLARADCTVLASTSI